jgi:iron complex transport system substrate-binding protein
LEDVLKRIPFPIALVAVALLAACGDNATVSPAPAGRPSVTQVTTVPTKIVSLSPTATEMLYAIGAGDQVLAVDDQSNYPAEVLQKPHDLSGFQPNVEAIAALKPDLVLIGDDSAGLSTQLKALQLNVWIGPAAQSFDDVYNQIEQLGATTGHAREAAALTAKMRADIDMTVKAAPKPANPLTYYHELDNTYYSVTQNTFIGQVYALFGLRSIADLQEVDSDYPQLSAEAIISANPDVIFLADGGFGESPETVAARPGWSALKAVVNGNVVVVDADVASRWGPRVVDYVKAVAAALAKVTG